jgi:hypothetical protein
MKKRNEPVVFKNRHGKIALGTKVSFMVENQDQWAGDLVGVLIFQDGKFKVQTERSGILTIDEGYNVYFNTIKPF